MERSAAKPGPRDGSAPLVFGLAGVIAGLVLFILFGVETSLFGVIPFVLGGALAGVVAAVLWTRRRSHGR